MIFDNHLSSIDIPAAVPIATPPAKVEFCTCTILNLLSLETNADTANATTQLADIDSKVLIIARC